MSMPEVAGPVPLKKGDIVVMASSELLRRVSEATIGRVLADPEKIRDGCTKLADLAESRGGLNNVTVIASFVSLILERAK